ncbi:MAG: hypothetical protein Q4A54_14005, partial [Parabacteroides sp.]|nr:hypothetical protein [Parabacteroides sp.]
ISGHIYQSIVYAKIICGLHEWFIVYNQNEAAFEMVDQYDRTVNPYELKVETIQEGTEGYKEYEGSGLLKFKNYCKRNL